MRRQFAIMVATIGLIAACGGAEPTPDPTAPLTPAPPDIFVPTEEPAPTEPVEIIEDPAVTPVDGERYTVKQGDTMWAISQDYGISLEALRAANPDVDPRRMRVGTVLIIPAQE